MTNIVQYGKDQFVIDADEYREIQEQLRWLSCLEEAGVDNWGGIGFAKELHQERINEEDDE